MLAFDDISIFLLKVLNLLVFTRAFIIKGQYKLESLKLYKLTQKTTSYSRNLSYLRICFQASWFDEIILKQKLKKRKMTLKYEVMLSMTTFFKGDFGWK